MSFDEALIILSTGADFQKGKFNIAMKMGGMPRAVDEAMDIARECIKRCRDFDQIRRVEGGTTGLCAETACVGTAPGMEETRQEGQDVNTDDYYELLEEQHEHDVVLTLSQVDAEEDGNATAEVPEMRERERA